MIATFLVYKWAILGSSVTGALLALVGAQLASRDQSVKSLVVSQSASFGVTVGLVLASFFEESPLVNDFFPLITGFFLALGFDIFLRVFGKSLRGSDFVAVFAVLLALTYALTSLAPGLESHMSSAYFGDLSVASDSSSVFMIFLSLFGLLFFHFAWERVTSYSFSTMMFGQVLAEKKTLQTEKLFWLLSIGLITASVQVFGLLFTISCLFLPVFCLGRKCLGIHRLAQQLIFIGISGVFIGFVFSIWIGVMPTVPSVVLATLLLGWSIRGLFSAA